MEFKGIRMSDGIAGAVFGPEGKEFPWRDTTSVVADVVEELERQNAKWGVQNHPDGTGPASQPLVPFTVEASSAGVLANLARESCEAQAGEGELTWADILLEEVFEALAEDDPGRLETELIQVAAVAVQWALAVRRRADG